MGLQIEIPKGWKVAELKDVCQAVTGTTPPKADPKNYGFDIPFVKPPQLFDKPVNNAPEKLSLKGAKIARILPPNSVLVTCIGNLGRTAINTVSVAFNQQINALIPSKEVDSKFLFYQTQSWYFRKQLDELSSATTVAIVNKGKFETIEITIPPGDAQIPIVEKIEELFSELDKGIENLKTSQQQLKVYRQAVLKWAFEGKLTNDNVKDGQLPYGWEWVSITDLASKRKHALKAGPFGSSLKKEFYVESGYKIYGQEQVIKSDALYGDYYINEEKYEELSSNKVHAGDVLISLVGTVGKVLVLPENCREGIINPRLIKITLDAEKYIPKFFKYYFESSTVKSYYSSKAQGTTMDVLNLGIIKTIPFPLCPISQQEEVILEIESRLSVCDKMEETISTSLQQAEALRQSILKRAFEGKLVKAEKELSETKVLINNEVEEDWERKVLAGNIIFAFQRGGYIGRTKLQKMLYLCEQHAELDYETDYIKEAAGPLDSKFLYAFLDEARQKNWIEETPVGNGYKYEPSTAISHLTKDYPKFFRPKSEKITFVIKLLKEKDTDTSELIATIYAVWNNYIIGKDELNNELLVKEVYDWDESKIKFNKRLILSTWQWMKEEGLVPVGFGKLISKVA